MNKFQGDHKQFSPELLTGLTLVFFFGLALFLRIYLPHDQIFGGEWVKFSGVDAYYHMRMVDNLVHNFPHFFTFDPYLFFPKGALPTGGLGDVYLFDWLLAGVIWMIGLGSPSAHTIDAVAAYFPTVLAALTVIPVYFIGRQLFGRRAGIFAAGLIAVMPGEFLGRSLLGFTDHHIAETLLTTTAMLFLVMAVKTSQERGLTCDHFWRQSPAMLRRPVIYGLLGGAFLTTYLVMWFGGLLFAFTVAAYFLIQSVIDHLNHRSDDYLVPVGLSFFIIPFLVALVIYVRSALDVLYLISLSIPLLLPAVLSMISRLMTGMRIRAPYYPAVLVGLGAAGIGLFYNTSPSLFQYAWSKFSIFIWNSSPTIAEMQPLFIDWRRSLEGEFSFAIAWGNFTTGFFISVILLLYWIFYTKIWRHRNSPEKNVLIVWSIVILLATLGQRRFAYYLAVNIALLTGYLSGQLLQRAAFGTGEAKPGISPPVAAAGKGRQKRKKKDPVLFTWRQINISLVLSAIFFFVFLPNLRATADITRQVPFTPPDAWVSSLYWLRENTPEPFGDPDFYFQRYNHPAPGEVFDFPETAYGVAAWSDYGYWIARIARRPVNSTPGPGGSSVAELFLARDEKEAQPVIEKLDSAYIVLDYLTVMEKFWALVQWAGKDRSQFYEAYLIPGKDNGYSKVNLFYPEYYHTLAVRLYCFDGRAVTPRVSTVVSYKEVLTPEGRLAKVLTDVNEFPGYQAALAYIENQESGGHKIVSDDPLSSPVPLVELQDYKLIHGSEELVGQLDMGWQPAVKIFQYIPAD